MVRLQTENNTKSRFESAELRVERFRLSEVQLRPSLSNIANSNSKRLHAYLGSWWCVHLSRKESARKEEEEVGRYHSASRFFGPHGKAPL